jgi:uncharacterized membrane protein
MIDIDLNDVQILTSREIDMGQVAYVEKVESNNEILKYGLIFSGVLFCSFLLYLWHENKKQNETNFIR